MQKISVFQPVAHFPPDRAVAVAPELSSFTFDFVAISGTSALLPLTGLRRLAGDIIRPAVHPPDLIHNPPGDLCQERHLKRIHIRIPMREPRP
jgi:hypothetical protein